LILITLLLTTTACAGTPTSAGDTKAGGVVQSAAEPSAAAVSPTSVVASAAIRISVAFKVDPRLSGGSYGGERWVAPRAFSSAVQQGPEARVEAKVKGFDARGAPVRIDPTWTAADPTMVIVSPVSPGATDHVAIAVTRAGETKLTIAALGVAKELRVKATSAPNGQGIQLTISQ
jgi:hypothetical protein